MSIANHKRTTSSVGSPTFVGFLYFRPPMLRNCSALRLNVLDVRALTRQHEEVEVLIAANDDAPASLKPLVDQLNRSVDV
jgi:hypothetical protein